MNNNTSLQESINRGRDLVEPGACLQGHQYLIVLPLALCLEANMFIMHLSIETPTPGKYGALMGVTKGFGTFLCPRGWGICCFLLHQFCPRGGGLVRL